MRWVLVPIAVALFVLGVIVDIDSTAGIALASAGLVALAISPVSGYGGGISGGE